MESFARAAVFNLESHLCMWFGNAARERTYKQAARSQINRTQRENNGKDAVNKHSSSTGKIQGEE